MTTYQSKSSTLVKIITISAISALLLLVISLIFIRKDFDPLTGSILGVIVFGVVFYFYGNLLKRIIITVKSIVLEKVLGKIEIKVSQIESVKKMKYSALPITVGSKGFFGFIGSTMDDSISFVKDRKKMILLTTTSKKKYLFSCDNSKELVNLLSTEKTHLATLK